MEFAHTPPSVSEKSSSVCNWLEEKKGADVSVLNISQGSGFADRMIIVSAHSVRQAQALADDICKQYHDTFHEKLNREGYENGQWILLDAKDIVINIFQEETRKIFNLEGLWGNAHALRVEVAGSGKNSQGANMKC